MFQRLTAVLLVTTFISPIGLGIAQEAPEPETGHATVTIRHGTEIVWSGDASFPLADATTTISSTSGESVSVPAKSLLATLVALDAAEDEFSISDLSYFSSFDSFLINCITDPAISAEPQCNNWQYVVNNTYPQIGTDDYLLNNGDTVFLYFGSPRRFSVEPTETVPTVPADVLVEEYDYTDGSWHALSGAAVGATLPNTAEPWNPTVVTTATSNANGIAQISLDTVGTYGIGLAQDFYGTTTPLLVRELESDEVIVRIRNGEDFGFQGITTLETGTTSISDTGGAPHDVSASSALAALWNADQASNKFSISNLQYFSSFNSLYIKCITLGTEACDNWQYAVNGFTPGVSADTYGISPGDELFFFFGSPRRVTLSDASVNVNESFTAVAEHYVPSSDTFEPIAGFTIGVTQVNPDDPFTPLEIATSTVNASGEAIFALNSAGSYAVGLKEDFYFPATALNVSEIPPPSGGGSGGTDSGRTPPSSELNIAAAISFLTLAQNADGSFATPLLSDWGAIALSAGSASDSAKNKLRDYLVSSSAGLSNATDYERRAMALMALGVNPYTPSTSLGASDTSVDYIAKMLTYFDGTQFGDSSLVNDDIFAIYPLIDAGHTASDDVIQKTVSFIVSKQKPDGSWESSVDLTGAAVQALTEASSLPSVSDALTKAKSYLHAKQQTNGGFENGQSTSWALQAIAAFGDSISLWTVGGKTPEDYLVLLQQTDGGLEGIGADSHTRIWSTEYAIPAALGRTWNSILQNFSKPSSSSTSGSGGASNNAQATATSASTSIEVAPATPLILGISTSKIPEIIDTPLVPETKKIAEKPAVKKNAPQKQVAATTTVTLPPVQPVIEVLPKPSVLVSAAANAEVEIPSFGSRISGWFKKIGSLFYDLFF